MGGPQVGLSVCTRIASTGAHAGHPSHRFDATSIRAWIRIDTYPTHLFRAPPATTESAVQSRHSVPIFDRQSFRRTKRLPRESQRGEIDDQFGTA